jgi:hypothetical protein
MDDHLSGFAAADAQLERFAGLVLALEEMRPLSSFSADSLNSAYRLFWDE